MLGGGGGHKATQTRFSLPYWHAQLLRLGSGDRELGRASEPRDVISGHGTAPERLGDHADVDHALRGPRLAPALGGRAGPPRGGGGGGGVDP